VRLFRLSIQNISVLCALSVLSLACKEESKSSSSSSQNANTATQGPQGPQGPQGAQGATGPAGAAGSFHSVSIPTRLSTSEIASLSTEMGYQNMRTTPVMIYGSIQLWNVNRGCKTADIQIKWNDTEAWMTLQHYYHETRAWSGSTLLTTNGGARYNPTLMLAPGSKIRVVANTNPNCMAGDLYVSNEWFASVAQ